MNEYESCKTDKMIIQAAKDANNSPDNPDLHTMRWYWCQEIAPAVDSYSLDYNLGTDWVEEHPLNIIMLDKVSELMGLELRENSLAKVNNAYDWLASAVNANEIKEESR